MESIIGLIPSAGKGTRMQQCPIDKELLTVGYKTMNGLQVPKLLGEYTLDNMLETQMDKVLFVINENKVNFMSVFQPNQLSDVTYSFLLQKKALAYGMPVAIDSAYSWIKGHTVLLGMPDTIVTPKTCFNTLLELMDRKEADLVLGIFPTDHPTRLAPVKYDEETGQVYKIYDKPRETTRYNSWNIVLWRDRFTELIHKKVGEAEEGGKELLLSDCFNQAVNEGLRVYSHYFAEGACMDLGNMKEFKDNRQRIEEGEEDVKSSSNRSTTTV